MNNESSYKEQKNLSSIQLLAEVPTLIETLLSAIFSGALLLYVDLLDSLGYILRYALLIILSKKLSKNLKYEYNYGIGKVEAMSSLMCDGIVLFGMFLTVLISIYSIFFPSKPSELLIGVAGFKLYDIIWDLAFFVKQRKISKSQNNTMGESNYAAALGVLLFDVIAFVSLMLMWLLRDNPIGGYISPVVSIGAVIYLTIGCVKRIKTSLIELTDKTLPEEDQMKILNILNKYDSSYSQFHSIDSRKSGEVAMVDIHLSFVEGTKVEQVASLQKQMQEELNRQLGKCVVKIIVKNELV